MEGNLPSGLPDQAARGRQDGRGLGEVLAPQPLEAGPAVRAEAPAEVVAAAESGLPSSEQVAAAGAGARPEQGAAAEGVPPEQVAAAQGAAVTDGAQPEQVQVAAAMDSDSPVRAESSVQVPGDVTAAAVAMEGVPVEGQAGIEEEAPPGPLAMVVYSGGASGAAAAVGAAMTTELSLVRSAAPVTPAPARPSLEEDVVGRQRTRFTMDVFRQASRVKPWQLGKVPSGPIIPESRAKRKATKPVAGSRKSSRVAQRLVVQPLSSVPEVEAGENAGTGEELGTGEPAGAAEAVAAEEAVGTGEGNIATGAREEWYTRRGPIDMEELLGALQEEERFVFVRWEGRIKAYTSQDPTVRPPPALAALKLEDVLPLEWDREQQPTLRVGPTIPFWDPRIIARMLRKGEVILSDEEMAWRLKTGDGRRNLWKFRESRPTDQVRLKQLEAAYLTAYQEYSLAHGAGLKAEEGDHTMYGVEEAQTVLAARELPVPPRTGKQQVEVEESEEDAEMELAVQQSLQPPVTGGGTHDVEAGTSGAVRQPVVVPPRSLSPVGGAAEESPVQATVPPVPVPEQATGRTVDAIGLEYLWMEMGQVVREILRRCTGTGGLLDDPRIDQLFNEYAAQFEDDDEGQ